MAGTKKGRIDLILKIKGSVHQATELRHEAPPFGSMPSSRKFLSRVFDGGDFPPTTDKAELTFRNGHYYF
ncbi:hypothetical protein [Pseudomonas sp.]|uniref:hypothetical protein n=1 Tax=Pseudomonas sp. TaxID=306 RepID=UPI00326610F1